MDKKLEIEEDAAKKKIEADCKIQIDVDDKLVGDDKIFEKPQKEEELPGSNY